MPSNDRDSGSPGRAVARRAARLGRDGRTLALVIGVGVLLGPAGEALAQPMPSSSALAAGMPPAEDLPLQELPKLLEPKLAPASPAAAHALEARLDQLRNVETRDPVEPKVDLAFLTKDVDSDTVSAVASRLSELRERLDGKKALAVLDRARDLGRKALRKLKKSSKKDEDGDWLQFLLALGKRGDDTWQDSVELYGMLRVLEAVGETPAVRLMVESYSYFGDLVRIDLQRAITRLHDRAVPALLEARQHDAKKVSRWARSQLDAIGKEIPGEAVQTTDAQVLADVLRAFGRTRDVEATGVILSFCNSERVALREAAREALAAIGKPAEWQLEDAYQALTGNAPPRAWSWDRTARELFRLYDRGRLERVYQQMQAGVTAQTEHRWADAVAAFDEVLAFLPMFERRAETGGAYYERAAELAAEGRVDEAVEMWRKSLRLAPEGPTHGRAESRIAYHEARALAEAGTPDVVLSRRAAELDPDFAPARELLAALDEKTVAREKRSRRYFYAGAVGAGAFLALLLLARRPRARRRQPGRTAAPQPASAPPSPADAGAAAASDASEQAAPRRTAGDTPVRQGTVAPTVDMGTASRAMNVTAPWSGAAPLAETAPPGSAAPSDPGPMLLVVQNVPESDAAPTLVRPPLLESDAAPTLVCPPLLESDAAPTLARPPLLESDAAPTLARPPDDELGEPRQDHAPESGPPIAVLTPRSPQPGTPEDLD